MKFNAKKVAQVLFAAVALALVFAEPSFANTGDATFNGPVQTITGWLGGSLGVLLSLIALAIAVMSAVAGKLGSLVTAVGVAIAIQVGPTVIAGIVGATLPAVA